MSAVLDAAPLTEQERSMLATRKLCDVLGLGVVKPTQLKRLTIALAEAAADEADHNNVFAKRILSLYEQYATHKQTTKTAPRKDNKAAGAHHADLVPIAYIDPSRLNPYGPPDPYLLLEIYGPAQLPLALDGYSLTALKGAASLVEQRNPGTKPRNRAKKDAVLAYIVEYVK